MSSDPFIRIFILLIIYTIFLFVIRILNIGRKKTCNNCSNCCPDCKSPLNRIQRKNSDKILFHLTFKIFNFKRYICNECGWEGLRWEDKFRPEVN